MGSDTSRRWWRKSDLWEVASVLLLGQGVSFILALLNFTSSLTANLDSLVLFLGAAVCGVGLCLVLLSDAGVGGGGGSNPLLGDMLVIGGTLFFALSNVGEEFCVKKNCQLEVLAMLGVFGMFFSLIEITIFERKNLEAVTWSTELILTLVGYTVGFFIFYSLTSFILKTSGSTLFNLSLLTADMWAVIIRIFFYEQKVDWLYYVSFLIVGVGLFIYSKSEKNLIPNPSPESENGNRNPQYQLVHEQGAETLSGSP